MNSQVGKNLAVQLNLSFLEAGDQLAIADTFGTRLGIDTSNPKCAESSFLGTTVTVCILTSFGDSLGSNSVNTTASTVITLGLF